MCYNIRPGGAGGGGRKVKRPTNSMKCSVATWLVRSFPDRVVRVRVLAWDNDIVPCSDLGFYQVFKWLPANKMLRGNPAMDSHPIQGGVEILLVDSCYRRRNKFRPDGLLGWYADFTIFYLYLFVENGLIIDDVNCYKKGGDVLQKSCSD